MHMQPGESGRSPSKLKAKAPNRSNVYSIDGGAVDASFQSSVDEDSSGRVNEQRVFEGDEEWEWEENERENERQIVNSSTSIAHTTSTTPKATRRRRNQAAARPRTVVIPRSPRTPLQAYRSRDITPAYTPPQVTHNPPNLPEISWPKDEPGLEIPWKEAPRHIASSFKASVVYLLDVLKPAVKMMKYPLILITFLLLLAMLLNSVAGIFRSAFAPFCYIPGVNMMGACQWINHPGFTQGSPDMKNKVQRADYPALVDLEAKTFDQLVDESMGLTGPLSLNLKKTEVACKDLITLVRLSDLASKDSLAETLVEFVQDARVTAEGLNRLTAKFNGALDNIMAVNDYALNTVEKARISEAKTPVEKLNALMPWSPPRKDVELVVIETFKGAMDMLSSQLERLITFAEASHRDLNKLEETLTVLHEIVQRENNTVAIDKDELLQQLWTKLGGNRKELRSFERHLNLLKELASYKKQAQAHVVAALHTLQTMSQEMDDIRERVAAPDLATPQIAPEVHMKSIQYGLERLKGSRIRARELDREATRKILEADYGDQRVPLVGRGNER